MVYSLKLKLNSNWKKKRKFKKGHKNPQKLN